MAGGTWIDQNKVRPGVYINYSSSPATLATMGERGVVCVGKALNWGEFGKVITIEDPSECFVKLGYDQMSDEMIWLRQFLVGTNRSAGASKVLVWRLQENGGVAATSTQSDTDSSNTITVTAKFTGTRGNDISVIVSADPDNSSSKTIFYVQTLVSGTVVDNQILSSSTSSVVFSGVKDNDWVKFNVAGNAFPTSLTLTGGENGTESETAFSDFLNAMELENWNVIAYGGSDNVIKSALALFVKRLSDDEGKKVQACLSGYPSADTECVISITNQRITLASGYKLTEEEMVYWVAGASSGASVSQSLTYAAHPDGVSLSPILTGTQQVEAINNGELAFIDEYGDIKILQDNNTFTTFSATKGRAFRKNRVIRVLFGLANDIYKVFSQYYVGNTDNDDFGRGLLKAEILELMNRYQGNRALKNVDSDDVTVTAGVDSDSVVVDLECQPVDSIEKIYIKITIS